MSVYFDGTFAFATSATDQHALLNTALGRHAAFTQVEEFSPQANVFVTVWRNAGASNGTARDFHILLWRNITTGYNELFMCVTENYDPVANAVIRPIPAAGSAAVSLIAPASDYSFGGGGALLLGTGIRPPVELGAIALPAGDGRLYAVVTNRGLKTFFTDGGNGTQAIHATVFESFLGADDPMPLILTSGGIGLTSRHPFMTASHANAWRVQTNADIAAWTLLSGQMGGNGDRFYNNRPLAARRAVRHVGEPHIFGGVRGLMYDVLQMTTVNTQVIVGDTVIVGNDTYVWTGTWNTWLNLSSA